jgi:hypothetical protein
MAQKELSSKGTRYEFMYKENLIMDFFGVSVS